MKVTLLEFMDRDDGWGHEEGRQVHFKLLTHIEQHPTVLAFAISLSGVKRTDASFARESVIELARRFKGQRGFCLVDIVDPNLIENWDAAATRIGQPIFVWNDTKADLIGPKPTEGTADILNYILESPFVTASSVVKKFDMGIQNASNKLNRLWRDGYILRRENVAPSGGTEYQYFRIK